MTYDQIKAQYLRNIGKSGSTDTTILADFNSNLAQRYQLIFANMRNYQTQQPSTNTTVAGTQYYSYPPGIVSTDDVVITIGNVLYPLQTIYSQHSWDLLNAIQFQGTSIPQFLFPRRGDYGIWPIPQDAYTITFYYFLRDRNLSIADYTTGTVDVTSGDATITATGGATFIPAMIGRWFTVTTDTNTGQGYWYRILTYTDSTHMELDRTYVGATGTSLSYIIGQTPEIPEEGHILLVDGPTADYYAGLRNSPDSANWFDNRFWTGSGQQTSRDLDDDNITGGLIGLARRYQGRDDKHVIERNPQIFPPSYQIFGTSLSA